MSITRRIIDGAKSGLSSMIERVVADDTPLSHVDGNELQRELERRIAARKDAVVAPGDNPRARWAGGSAEAATKRKQLAEERSRRVSAERAKRQSAEQAARDRAYQAAKAQAERDARSQRNTSAGSSAGSSSARSSSAGSSSARSSSSDTGGARSARSPFARESPAIAKHYKTLNLAYGADFKEVKAAYRKLMRRYHPDLHHGSEKKEKAATELSVRVTEAYDALDAHLNGK